MPPEINAPRFSIITKAMSGDTQDGRRRFKATASSTITDRAGDEISLKALQQMAEKFRAGVTIFTDHENKVANAFGTTDNAEIVQRGQDRAGTAIWDLDIAGVVNEPNPNAVQLHDSIAGGYVQLGCSIDAFVLDHERKKSGGLSIDGLDVYAASIVGVPMNQRSWTQKALRAIKSFHGEAEEEDALPPETEAAPETPAEEPEVSTSIPLDMEADDPESPGTETPEIEATEKSAMCPTCGKGKDGAGCSDDYHTMGKSIESAVNAGGQESPVETPEAAPETPSDETDPLVTEKALAFEATDVVELARHAATLAIALTERDAKIAELTTERDRLASENEEAKQVIEKMVAMPLRPKAVGVAADFSDHLPDFLAPEVRKYLTTAGDR